MTIETIHWHTLHPRYLDSSSRVLDLGANNGEYSSKIISRFGCKCFAVEPSPGMFEEIPELEGLVKYNIAITPTEGRFDFHICEESTASSLVTHLGMPHETITVAGVTLEAFVAELGWDGIDLLKSDIEGAEVGMFDSCSDEFLRKVSQISVEFHDFAGITPRAEILRIFRRLERLGFYGIRMSGNGHLDTWFINRERCNISIIELLYIKYVLRNWVGAGRVVGRMVGRDR